MDNSGNVHHPSLNRYAGEDIYSSYKNTTLLCRIDEVVCIDNDKNTSKNTSCKKTQYTVTVVDGPLSGMRIFGVIDGTTSGDGANFSETIRKTTSTTKILGPECDRISETDGENVLVGFIGGSLTAPIIIGSSIPAKNSETFSAKTADGCVTKTLKNGILTTTDKDGNHTTEIVAVYDADGNVTNESAVGTKTTIKANGDMEMTTGGDTPATTTMTKGGAVTTDSQTVTTTAATSMNTKCGGAMVQKSDGAYSLDASVTKIGGGGPCTARIGDMVISEGIDSNGDSHCLVGHIVGGSPLTLIGG